MGDILIRGGTVVDGTGSEEFRADVRVRAGVIVEMAPDLTPDGEPVVDASGAYVGHLSLRTYVMGADAWERAATSEEIDEMAARLDAGLRAGAMGLSVNHFDKDRALRPVPGYFAGDDEYRALFAVVARHRPA